MNIFEAAVAENHHHVFAPFSINGGVTNIVSCGELPRQTAGVALLSSVEQKQVTIKSVRNRGHRAYARTDNGSDLSADRADNPVACPSRNCLRSEANSKGYCG
jgi:hypothetical protein